MAAIAARTTTIRIGSAGVMLPHYSALKVAEQFRVLEALAPGRIDLGLGRAPGGDMRTARALNPNASHAAPRTFPIQVRDLQAWTSLGTPRRHHRASARAARARDLDPRQLRLRRAARGALRPALCVRLFLHRRPGRRAGDGALSRAATSRASAIPQPQATLCIWALAADDRRGGGAPRAVARPLAHRSRSAARSGRCSRPTRSPRAASATAEAATLAPMRAQGLRRLGAQTVARQAASPRRATSRSTRS